MALASFSGLITEVVSDARDYADHADRDDVDANDVRLALQGRQGHASAQPPSGQVILCLISLLSRTPQVKAIWIFYLTAQVMMAVALERNKTPLPPVPSKPGVLLPPDRFALTQPNYQIDLSKSNA